MGDTYHLYHHHFLYGGGIRYDDGAEAALPRSERRGDVGISDCGILIADLATHTLEQFIYLVSQLHSIHSGEVIPGAGRCEV